MATATGSDVDPEPECPVLGGEALEEYEESLRTAKAFTKNLGAFLDDRDLAERAAWIKTCVRAARPLFQPWVMEILYVIANAGTARFNEMRGLLGLSSRTLSDKLKMLEAEGLVDRTVRDTRPVRVDYTLTRRGWEAAALMSPLFAHLNVEAVSAARKL